MDNIDNIDDIDTMEPMPKPTKIKINNIIYIDYLDNLFSTKWKQSFFKDEIKLPDSENNLLNNLDIP